MSNMLPYLRLCWLRIVSAASLLSLLLAGELAAQNGGERKLPRPQTAPLRVEKVSPAVREILEEWYRQTSAIKTLQGYHSRYVYDLTFDVERRSVGRFYYEAPDKGRIDIEPAKIRAGEKAQRRNPKTNKPFALQADHATQWLSTGRAIFQIDPVNKKANRFPIPPQSQGKNIMDGPLPFLLGMPPDKAIQRYRIKIMTDKQGRPINTADQVWLQVWPKWKSDAANYREAKVILNKKNHYLPSAVQLIDPSGMQETVYTFYRTDVNSKNILATIFGRNPFDIDLRDYKIESAIPQAKGSPGETTGRARVTSYRTVPNLIGVPFKEAKAKLAALGFNVEFRKGNIAQRQSLIYCVETQFPRPNSQAPPGSRIVLTLFVKAADLQRKTAKP